MDSKGISHAPTEWILVDYMYCDESYQRPLNQNRAQSIAVEFDPDAFGVPTLSKRAGDRFMIIDGRHRIEALRILGWNGQKISCRVFQGLSQAQEAKLFNDCNNTRALQFIDRFLSRITSGDPIACEIAKITSAAGYRIDRTSRDTTITAARALQDVYLGKGQRIQGKNPVALKHTLLALTDAWGRTRASVGGSVIQGVGAFFLRYGPAIDRDRLEKKLAAIVSGPTGLVQRGKGKREMHGGSITSGIAHYLTEEYNRGLRGKKKLLGWRETEDIT